MTIEQYRAGLYEPPILRPTIESGLSDGVFSRLPETCQNTECSHRPEFITANGDYLCEDHALDCLNDGGHQ